MHSAQSCADAVLGPRLDCGDAAWSSAAAWRSKAILAGLEAALRGGPNYAFVFSGQLGPGGSPVDGRITARGRSLDLRFRVSWNLGALVQDALPSASEEERLAAMLRTTPWLKTEAVIDGAGGDGLVMSGTLPGGAWIGADAGVALSAHFAALEGLAATLQARETHLRAELMRRLQSASPGAPHAETGRHSLSGRPVSA